MLAALLLNKPCFNFGNCCPAAFPPLQQPPSCFFYFLFDRFKLLLLRIKLPLVASFGSEVCVWSLSSFEFFLFPTLPRGSFNLWLLHFFDKHAGLNIWFHLWEAGTSPWNGKDWAAVFSPLSLPDTCFWWRSRTATRSSSIECCCRTSRSSCRLFTPPPWAWPASSTVWYFQDRGESRLKLHSKKK